MYFLPLMGTSLCSWRVVVPGVFRHSCVFHFEALAMEPVHPGERCGRYERNPAHWAERCRWRAFCPPSLSPITAWRRQASTCAGNRMLFTEGKNAVLLILSWDRREAEMLKTLVLYSNQGLLLWDCWKLETGSVRQQVSLQSAGGVFRPGDQWQTQIWHYWHHSD